MRNWLGTIRKWGCRLLALSALIYIPGCGLYCYASGGCGYYDHRLRGHVIQTLVRPLAPETIRTVQRGQPAAALLARQDGDFATVADAYFVYIRRADGSLDQVLSVYGPDDAPRMIWKDHTTLSVEMAGADVFRYESHIVDLQSHDNFFVTLSNGAHKGF